MSAVQTASGWAWASPVTGSTSQWMGQAEVSFISRPTTLNVTPLLVTMDAKIGSFPFGEYSAVYSATDANGMQFNSTSCPNNYTLTPSNSPMNFSCAFTLPSNPPNPYIASPLTVTITVTNIGGGGGGPSD
jgi:hypothetical protein